MQRWTRWCKSVPCGCDGLAFLPFLSGSVDPDACPEARAVFFGARLSTTRAHFARSVMESVAFLLRDFFGMLNALGCPADTVYSLGGGARGAVWQQIKADACGRTFRVPACSEATAMGAALLAGWGSGLIAPGVFPCRGESAVYLPDNARAPAYDTAYSLYKKLYSAVDRCATRFKRAAREQTAPRAAFGTLRKRRAPEQPANTTYRTPPQARHRPQIHGVCAKNLPIVKKGGKGCGLQHKPRLGILALMLEGYKSPLFPGIMASQHKYVEEVIASLSGTADFVFPRIAASREAI